MLSGNYHAGAAEVNVVGVSSWFCYSFFLAGLWCS